MAQTVKSLPAMQETWVQSLGWEDPQEKEMAIHSSILAWKIPRMEEHGNISPKFLQLSEQLLLDKKALGRVISSSSSP